MRVWSDRAALVCVALTGLVFAGCNDFGMTAPAAKVVTRQNHPTPPSLGTLLGLQTVAPIMRSVPLADDVSWSFTVGPDGAVSSNSAVGLTISVPSGAVSSPTTITVTALQGREVAYRFEPHGLQFARDVTLTQKLTGTSVESELAPQLSGAYFPDDEPALSDGLALVSEVISGLLEPLTQSFSFPITHFSGYLVASGRKDEGTQ
jgi:hypothetical protein